MQCFDIEDLKEGGLPERLPPNTEMGVWKRSTGYEVILPFHRSRAFWLLLFSGFILLVILEVLVGKYSLPSMISLSIGQKALLYFGMVLPVVGYLTAVAAIVSITRTAQVRIDMTPLTMTFTRIRPAGPAKKIGEVAVKQIREVCYEPQRGLQITGMISDMKYSVWVARGLTEDDLYYLTCLIGKNASLNLQDTNPLDIDDL